MKSAEDYTSDIPFLCEMCELVYTYEEAAYENDPRHLELFKKYGKADKYWDYDFGLQIGIWSGTSPNEKIVCFRGTDEMHDWTYNFDTDALKLDSGSTIHEGFDRHIHEEGAFEKVVAQLKANGIPAKIIVTGHSLGGACALLSSYYLAKEFTSTKVEAIVFGAPRVGYESFGKEYLNVPNLAVPILIRHTNDPVSRIPFAPFQPFGIQIWLNYPTSEPVYESISENPLSCCELCHMRCCNQTCNYCALLCGSPFGDGGPASALDFFGGGYHCGMEKYHHSFISMSPESKTNIEEKIKVTQMNLATTLI